MFAFSVIIFLITTPIKAQIYEWVDEQGNTHYTNTMPPQNARVTNERPETTMSIEEEMEALDLQSQYRQEQYQKEQARRDLEERRRSCRQQQLEKQREQDRIADKQFQAEQQLQAMVNAEKKRLGEKRDRTIKNCYSHDNYKSRNPCIRDAKNKYERTVADLKPNPVGYFNEQEYQRRMEPFREMVRDEVQRQLPAHVNRWN